SDQSLELLERKADVYRSSQLFQLLEPEVRSLQVENRNGISKVVRDDDGLWWLYSGSVKKLPVDAQWFQALTERLREGRIEEFLPRAGTDLRQYGLVIPDLKVELEPQRGEPEKLWVGKRVDPGEARRYLFNLRWRDFLGIGYMPAEEILQEAPWSLRSLKVLDFDPQVLRKITVRTPEGRVETFVRPQHQWKRQLDRSVIAEADMGRLLEAVAALEAIRWESSPEEAPGPDSFALGLELIPLSEQAFPRRQFWVGAPQANRERLVRDGDGGWVFRVRVAKGNDPFAVIKGHFMESLPR
ncbi:MAG: DUF4340 domain-containing protein, partial [Planctomycetota bacterium]